MLGVRDRLGQGRTMSRILRLGPWSLGAGGLARRACRFQGHLDHSRLSLVAANSLLLIAAIATTSLA
jgi:hypothetical protein